MSGKRYLLDTNAIVALLQGNNQLLQLLRNAEWVGISIRPLAKLRKTVILSACEGSRRSFACAQDDHFKFGLLQEVYY